MKSTLLLLLTLPTAMQTWAVLGSESQQKSFDPICRITIYKGDRKLHRICSGGLVSKTQILTGRHCFAGVDSQSFYKVSCGFIKAAPSSTKIEKGADGNGIDIEGLDFKEKNLPVKKIEVAGWTQADLRTHHQIDPRDVALITLVRPSKLSPIPISFEEVLKKNLKINECLLAGFGFSADGHAGILQTAPLENPELIVYSEESHLLYYRKKSSHHLEETDFEKNFSTGHLRKKLIARDPGLQNDPSQLEIHLMVETARAASSMGFLKSISMPGDSGSPLICKINQKPDWTVVGVLLRGDYEVDQNVDGAFAKAKYDFVATMIWSAIDFKNLMPLTEFQRLKNQSLQPFAPMPSLPKPDMLPTAPPK